MTPEKEEVINSHLCCNQQILMNEVSLDKICLHFQHFILEIMRQMKRTTYPKCRYKFLQQADHLPVLQVDQTRQVCQVQSQGCWQRSATERDHSCWPCWSWAPPVLSALCCLLTCKYTRGVVDPSCCVFVSPTSVFVCFASNIGFRI